MTYEQNTNKAWVFMSQGLVLMGSGHTDRSECDMIKNDPFNTIYLCQPKMTHLTQFV